MDIRAVGERLVELCNQGKNFDVMHTMYAEDIVSVEPTGKATAGKGAVIKKSEVWAAGVTIHGETVAGPFFHGADKFATQTTFEVTRKATGERVKLDEVTVYTVNGEGLITREVFYFGGDQW